MLMCFSVLILGIEFGMRTNSFLQLFSVPVSKKFRFISYFCAWIVSFLLFHAGINSIESWYLMIFALFLLPIFKIGVIRSRKKQIPERTVNFLDIILLNLKAGQSLRKALLVSSEEEKTWFRSFVASLIKSLEAGKLQDTESEWFNRVIEEILIIEKSRNKVIEQLEVLRKYLRQEQNFKKKINNASSGPRAQVFVMGLLFFGLNIFAFRGLDASTLKILLPTAWFLFFSGVAMVFLIVRSFAWKV